MSGSHSRLDETSAAAWRRSAARLLDDQLWAFGYDIRRPQGNLLAELGCTRIAAPAASGCSSCYQADLPTGERLSLRGFGVLCDDRDSSYAVFLHRSSFDLSWTAASQVRVPWVASEVRRSANMPLDATVRGARLVQRIASWIADYERRVSELLGASYRHVALRERGKPVVSESIEPHQQWRQVGADLNRWPWLLEAERLRRKPKRRRAAKALSSR